MVVVEEVQDKKREEIQENIIAVKNSSVKSNKIGLRRNCKTGKFIRKSNAPRSGGSQGGGGGNGKVLADKNKCVK